MRYSLLLAAVSFAGFAAMAAIAAAAVAVLWRRKAASLSAGPPDRRAAQLVALRLVPALAGLLTMASMALAFVRYEPAATGERPGWMLAGLAATGVMLWLAASWRATRDGLHMARVARLARQCPVLPGPGTDDVAVVDASYPVAAVAAWRRPQVLVSSRILAECPVEEVDLIVAHERAHVAGGDNIVRALLRALPDPLGVTGAGREIERSWTLAVEEVADDRAAGDCPQRRATLASALVRVAGLADGSAPRWMPALAFYQGEHLAQRVTALLQPRTTTGRPRRTGLTLAAGAALIVGAAASGARTIHQLTEWIVRSLP